MSLNNSFSFTSNSNSVFIKLTGQAGIGGNTGQTQVIDTTYLVNTTGHQHIGGVKNFDGTQWFYNGFYVGNSNVYPIPVTNPPAEMSYDGTLSFYYGEQEDARGQIRFNTFDAPSVYLDNPPFEGNFRIYAPGFWNVYIDGSIKSDGGFSCNNGSFSVNNAGQLNVIGDIKINNQSVSTRVNTIALAIALG